MEAILVETIEQARGSVAGARQRGLTVGLVPTMGALHAGHAALLQAARRETGFLVASIFVNPMQFGPGEDLARYPRQLEEDLRLCRSEGVDLVFAPGAEAMFPPPFRTVVEAPELQGVLCGPPRPGHFRGVATVVLKLLNIVQPGTAYFGQKDAQQVRIIEQMVRDLNVPVTIRVCPIVRAPDGLALSSRNKYLDAEERRNATVLHRTLEEIRSLIESGERDASRLRELMASRIKAMPGATLDYAEIVDAESLKPLTEIRGDILVALAVRFRSTRLIDNLRMFADASGISSRQDISR